MQPLAEFALFPGTPGELLGKIAQIMLSYLHILYNYLAPGSRECQRILKQLHLYVCKTKKNIEYAPVCAI